MEKLIWKTEQRRIKDLVPLEINPRKIDADRLKKLAENLERFNVVEIPVIDTDNKLLTFHQRLKALLMIGRGEEMIDVRVPNRKLTDKEIKEYNLIANTHAGDFDMDIFDEYFGDVVLEEIGVEMGELDMNVAFEEHRQELIEQKKAAMLQAQEDDYDIPDEIKTDIVRGDLFEIGPHRLLCGDSTNADDVGRLMGGEKADALVTDPPYNVSLNAKNMLMKKYGRGKDWGELENDANPKEFESFITLAIKNAFDFTKEYCGYFVWIGSSEWGRLNNVLLNTGFLVWRQIIWFKSKLVFSRLPYHWIHEPCFMGWKKGKMPDFTQIPNNETTVWQIDYDYGKAQLSSGENKSMHPTSKPVKLMAKCISHCSVEGGGYIGFIRRQW